MNYRNACPKCGGDIEGDGCTTAFHCENAEDWLYIEPDAQPVLCASYSYDDDADDDCKYCGGTGEPCHLQRGDGRCYPDYDKNNVDWDEFDDMTVKWKEKKKEKELIHELEQKERVLAEIADDDSVVEFKNLSYYLTDCMQPFGQLQYLSPEGIPIKEDLNILWIKEGYVEVQEMSWLKERVNYLSPLQPYSPYTRWWEVSELYEEWLYSKGCDQIIMIDFEKEYSQDVWYGIMRTYQSTTYTGGDGDDYED